MHEKLLKIQLSARSYCITAFNRNIYNNVENVYISKVSMMMLFLYMRNHSNPIVSAWAAYEVEGK